MLLIRYKFNSQGCIIGKDDTPYSTPQTLVLKDVTLLSENDRSYSRYYPYKIVKYFSVRYSSVLGETEGTIPSLDQSTMDPMLPNEDNDNILESSTCKFSTLMGTT